MLQLGADAGQFGVNAGVTELDVKLRHRLERCFQLAPDRARERPTRIVTLLARSPDTRTATLNDGVGDGDHDIARDRVTHLAACLFADLVSDGEDERLELVVELRDYGDDVDGCATHDVKVRHYASYG